MQLGCARANMRADIDLPPINGVYLSETRFCYMPIMGRGDNGI